MEALPIVMHRLNPEELSTIQQDLGEFGHKLFTQLLSLTSSEDTFESIIQRYKEKGRTFTDENFPPTKTSLLFPLSSSSLKPELKEWAGYTWKRLSEIPGYSNPIILPASISANDIIQGNISDSYFLSALGVLAEKPELINSLFKTTEINEAGVFSTKIFRNGIEKTILLDDYFPCTPEGKLAFSHSKENELWVMLLEKAWAKINSSYHLISQNTTQIDAIFEALTGAQCLVMNHDDENLWNTLVEGKEKGWVMSASAANTEASKVLLEEMGLIGGFAYAIIDIMELEMKDGYEFIVKFRNPWGTKEWSGEWSDSSNIWTEELRRKLDWHSAKSAEEKAFWMSYADFCHYFSRAQICKVGPDFVHSSLRLPLSIRPSCIKIEVKNPAFGFITVHRPDKGCCESKDPDYSIIRLIIAKYEPNEKDPRFKYQYIKGNMKFDRQISEDHNFEEGEYLLYVEAEKKKRSHKTCGAKRFCIEELEDNVPITLSLYAPKDISIKGDEWSKHPLFLENVYVSCALTSGDQYNYVSEGSPQCSKYSGMKREGYGYTYFENNSEDATIKEAVTYTTFDGLELVPPYKGTSYDVLIPPKSSKIVLLKQSSTSGYNLSFSYTSNIIFTTEAMKKRIKEYGTKVTRKDPHVNGDIDICVYTLKHGGGICYLYENLTKNLVLEENIKFKTVGLSIVGVEGNSITIRIGPGESKFIELKAITTTWNIQTSVSYGISPARKSTEEEQQEFPSY